MRVYSSFQEFIMTTVKEGVNFNCLIVHDDEIWLRGRIYLKPHQPDDLSSNRRANQLLNQVEDLEVSKLWKCEKCESVKGYWVNLV